MFSKKESIASSIVKKEEAILYTSTKLLIPIYPFSISGTVDLRQMPEDEFHYTKLIRLCTEWMELNEFLIRVNKDEYYNKISNLPNHFPSYLYLVNFKALFFFQENTKMLDFLKTCLLDNESSHFGNRVAGLYDSITLHICHDYLIRYINKLYLSLRTPFFSDTNSLDPDNTTFAIHKQLPYLWLLHLIQSIQLKYPCQEIID